MERQRPNLPTLSDAFVREIIIECKIKIRYKDVDILREVSKRPEIRFMWRISKDAGVPLFDGPVSEWNFLQKRLVYWLSFYDNIEGAYERPPSRIIYDNKAIDEWVKNKHKEAENESENIWAKGTSHKARSAYDHDEVYEFN